MSHSNFLTSVAGWWSLQSSATRGGFGGGLGGLLRSSDIFSVPSEDEDVGEVVGDSRAGVETGVSLLE